MEVITLTQETQYTASKQKTKEIHWVWLDTLPIAQIDIPYTNNQVGKEQITYLHSDHLNTPRWATNQSKQKVWTWNSDAYGATKANEDPSNTGKTTTIPLRFPGQYFDPETGLHYNYFRTYNPDLGRYTQPDPMGLEGGWNRFAYVKGNPVKWGDYLGLILQCPIKPPKNDSNWRPYVGYPEVFHCGYDTYLEAGRNPTTDDPINECTYDDNDCLVDENHKYAGCRGTPDQYTADQVWNHFFYDEGGVWHQGWGAFKESRRKNLNDLIERKIRDATDKANKELNEYNKFKLRK